MTPSQPRPSAGEVIREAESLISAGRYEYALEQLNKAQTLEPDNNYIRAITERVSLLLRQQQQITDISQRSSPTGFDERASRYLSVTVGAEFTDGIKADTPDEFLSPGEVEEKVRRLTSVAVNLFRRGSYDTAFDSLMKAYLLDPTSSHVMACERILLPAIELMRKRGTLSHVPGVQQTQAVPRPVQAQPPRGDHRIPGETPKRKAQQPSRNQVLRDDMATWSNPDTPPPAAGHRGGLFSKIKQGRFLG